LPLVIGGLGHRALCHPAKAIYDVSTDPVSVPDWLKPPNADQIWLKRKP
jgi:hypothetical protein